MTKRKKEKKIEKFKNEKKNTYRVFLIIIEI